MRINACSLFYMVHLQVSNLMSAETTNTADVIKHWCRFLYNQTESCRQVRTALKEDLIKFAEGLIMQCWNQSVWTVSVLLWQFLPPFYSRISKVIQKNYKGGKNKLVWNNEFFISKISTKTSSLQKNKWQLHQRQAFIYNLSTSRIFTAFHKKKVWKSKQISRLNPPS